MKLDALLEQLFPDGYEAHTVDSVVHGWGNTKNYRVSLIGTTDRAPIGAETSLALAGHVLEVMHQAPGAPILLLVSNDGQRLSHRDELLGNAGYLAHLAECLEVARMRGHQVISLVYEEAVSGGFLVAGMIADRTYALPDAQIRVMNLPAMSRITQIPLGRLEALCKTSPVFAPGVESFYQLGIVDEVWKENLSVALISALGDTSHKDRRLELGLERGGRMWAAPVVRRMQEA